MRALAITKDGKVEEPYDAVQLAKNEMRESFSRAGMLSHPYWKEVMKKDGIRGYIYQGPDTTYAAWLVWIIIEEDQDVPATGA